MDYLGSPFTSSDAPVSPSGLLSLHTTHEIFNTAHTSNVSAPTYSRDDSMLPASSSHLLHPRRYSPRAADYPVVFSDLAPTAGTLLSAMLGRLGVFHDFPLCFRDELVGTFGPSYSTKMVEISPLLSGAPVVFLEGTRSQSAAAQVVARRSYWSSCLVSSDNTPPFILAVTLPWAWRTDFLHAFRNWLAPLDPVFNQPASFETLRHTTFSSSSSRPHLPLAAADAASINTAEVSTALAALSPLQLSAMADTSSLVDFEQEDDSMADPPADTVVMDPAATPAAASDSRVQATSTVAASATDFGATSSPAVPSHEGAASIASSTVSSHIGAASTGSSTSASTGSSTSASTGDSTSSSPPAVDPKLQHELASMNAKLAAAQQRKIQLQLSAELAKVERQKERARQQQQQERNRRLELERQRKEKLLQERERQRELERQQHAEAEAANAAIRTQLQQAKRDYAKLQSELEQMGKEGEGMDVDSPAASVDPNDETTFQVRLHSPSPSFTVTTPATQPVNPVHAVVPPARLQNRSPSFTVTTPATRPVDPVQALDPPAPEVGLMSSASIQRQYENWGDKIVHLYSSIALSTPSDVLTFSHLKDANEVWLGCRGIASKHCHQGKHASFNDVLKVPESWLSPAQSSFRERLPAMLGHPLPLVKTNLCSPEFLTDPSIIDLAHIKQPGEQRPCGKDRTPRTTQRDPEPGRADLDKRPNRVGHREGRSVAPSSRSAAGAHTHGPSSRTTARQPQHHRPRSKDSDRKKREQHTSPRPTKPRDNASRQATGHTSPLPQHSDQRPGRTSSSSPRGRRRRRRSDSSSGQDSVSSSPQPLDNSRSRSRQVYSDSESPVEVDRARSRSTRTDVPSLGFRLAGLQIRDHADRIRNTAASDTPPYEPVEINSSASAAPSTPSRTEHLLEELLTAMRAPKQPSPDFAELLSLMRAQPQPFSMANPPLKPLPRHAESKQPPSLQPPLSPRVSGGVAEYKRTNPARSPASPRSSASPHGQKRSVQLSTTLGSSSTTLPASDDDSAQPISSTGARTRQAAAQATATAAEADRLLRIRDAYFKIKPEQLDSIPSLPLGSNIDDFSHFAKSATSIVTEVLERGDPDRLQTFTSSKWAPGWLNLLRKRVRSAVVDAQGSNRPLLEFIDATFQQVEAALKKNQDGPAAFQLFLSKLAEAWAPTDDTSGIDRLRTFGVASDETFGEYMRRFKALVATVMVSHHAFKPSTTQVQIAVRDSMRKQFPSLLSQLMTDQELEQSSPFGTADDCLDEMWSRLDRKAMAHTQAINGASYFEVASNNVRFSSATSRAMASSATPVYPVWKASSSPGYSTTGSGCDPESRADDASLDPRPLDDSVDPFETVYDAWPLMGHHPIVYAVSLQIGYNKGYNKDTPLFTPLVNGKERYEALRQFQGKCINCLGTKHSFRTCPQDFLNKSGLLNPDIRSALLTDPNLWTRWQSRMNSHRLYREDRSRAPKRTTSNAATTNAGTSRNNKSQHKASSSSKPTGRGGPSRN